MEEDSSDEESCSKLIMSNISIDEAPPANIPKDVSTIPVVVRPIEQKRVEPEQLEEMGADEIVARIDRELETMNSIFKAQ